MIRHLTAADYREMPWANGKGVTVEMLRIEAGGNLVLRLSRASVVEDGDFSIFPQIERNLTVISGPGFKLAGGGFQLEAQPLIPVAFAGDLPLRAVEVTAPSDDFNVMTARSLPRPHVGVHMTPQTIEAGGGLALFALGVGKVNESHLAQHDLIVTDQAARIDGPFIVVRLAEGAGIRF